MLNHAGQRRDGKYARQLIFHAALSPNKAAAEPGDQIEASLASHLRAQCPQTAAGASFILGAAGSCKQRGPGPPGRATQEPFRLISLAQHRSAHSSWRACSARDHHQASLHLPAATGLPRKAGLAANVLQECCIACSQALTAQPRRSGAYMFKIYVETHFARAAYGQCRIARKPSAPMVQWCL